MKPAMALLTLARKIAGITLTFGGPCPITPQRSRFL
jgi:hypothetical protein